MKRKILLLLLLLLLLQLQLQLPVEARIDVQLRRRMRIINSMRCMTEMRRDPSATYILYNTRHGILNTDFTVSWYPKTLFELTNHRLLVTAVRLRFFTTRAYLDNSIPLFYANFNKRNQC